MDTLMNAVVMPIVSSEVSIRPVAEFIRQHVDSTIDNCRLAQPYGENRKVDTEKVPQLPSC